MKLKYLEFDKLIVIDTGNGSEHYSNHEIIGPKIEINTTILLGDHEFDLEYIIESSQGEYRLLNSNSTITVKKI